MAERPPRVDRIAFGVSAGLIALVCIPLALSPQTGGALVVRAYESLTERFGLLYQWATLLVTVFLLWLAFSRHGAKRLGDDDSRPDFNIFSWMAMLFCAGIGAGLLYWSTIEWVTYLDAPPFGLAPSSTEAVEWAATYGIFHWGISAWALYCFPAVAIAIPYYRQHAPALRLSTGLHALIGREGYDRAPARIVDVLFILALVGGTGTSLGLGTPMVAACVSEVFGVEQTFGLQVGILVVCVTLFAISVYLGLERGIKPLSDGSVIAAILLLAFVLMVGPTNFLLRTGTNSIGLMIENFIRLNTWTDPVARTGFIEDMTVFYWAWWIAYGPFMGLFVTRISRGRTVRQLIFGMLIRHPRQLQHAPRSVGGPAGTRDRPGGRQRDRDRPNVSRPAAWNRGARGLRARRHRLHRDDLRLCLLLPRRVGDPQPDGRQTSRSLAPPVLGRRRRRAADHPDVHRSGRRQCRPGRRQRSTARDPVRDPGRLPAAPGR
ncbi:MAG: BCCT family transporter, partial [Acidobacteria bacterium]|nr:BCCT family transporter [Acidobacteriota bacterium]